MKMTKLINIFGAPASGKTSMSYALAARLKQRGDTVFLAQEFATELILAGRFVELANQDFLFAEMLRRISLAYGKVDYIITDCPLLINLVYLHKNFKTIVPKLKWQSAFEAHIIAAHQVHKGINILMEFSEEMYTADNRIHTIKDCLEIEKFTKEMFAQLNEPYSAFKTGDVDGVMTLIDSLA